MDIDSLHLQTILQNIVKQRRANDREFVRHCDKFGQTVISGVRGKTENELWHLHSCAIAANGSSLERSISVTQGDPAMKVIDGLCLTPFIELRTDLLVHKVNPSTLIHFRTMAGDKISFVADGEDLSDAGIEGYLGFGTHLHPSTERKSYHAEFVVRQFVDKATLKERNLFLTLLNKHPTCEFRDTPFGDKFRFEFDATRERAMWSKVFDASFRNASQERRTDEERDAVWFEVLKSFEDPNGHFSRLVRVMKLLNHCVCADDRFFRQGTRCHIVLKEAKQRFLTEAPTIVEELNSGNLDRIDRDLLILRRQLTSIQIEECDERKRKLEAWLGDQSVNRHGIVRGVINRYRYELSTYGDTDTAFIIRDTVVKRDRGICQYCGKTLVNVQLLPQENYEFLATFHIDHIVPLSRGGTNDLTNLQLLCNTCNLTKGSMLEGEMDPVVIKRLYKHSSNCKA